MTNIELVDAITKFPVFGAKRSVRVEADNGISAVIPIGIKLTVHHDTDLSKQEQRMQLMKATDNESVFGVDCPVSFLMDLEDIEFIGYENKQR